MVSQGTPPPLYVGKLPLTHRRNQLLVGYTAQFWANLYTLNISLEVGVEYTSELEQPTRSSNVLFKECLLTSNQDKPRIYNIKMNEIAPWKLERSHIDTSLLKYKKTETNELLIKSELSSIISDTPRQ